MSMDTAANPAVLEFYRRMPFNMAGDPATLAENVRSSDETRRYPPFEALLTPNRRVLEVGCGTGWMSVSMALHRRCIVTGIDFNPVAVEFARALNAAAGASATFETADLFTYVPTAPADVVVSLGVLHHTDDCRKALRVLSERMVRPGGFLFVGLYHTYGRRPFLDRFEALRRDGRTEDELCEEFRALFGDQQIDETHLQSWFRDQVLHPHETCHTLGEIAPVLQDAGMTVLTSSLNDYRPIRDLAAVIDSEAAQEETGRERLRERRYFPGFFTVLAKRKS